MRRTEGTLRLNIVTCVCQRASGRVGSSASQRKQPQGHPLRIAQHFLVGFVSDLIEYGGLCLLGSPVSSYHPRRKPNQSSCVVLLITLMPF